ncbi:MAG TPA: GIY-YIG nuclease family protein, partial [Chitinispirillaceae bacterium]|nr:GIY-YIG nuclease family protein [Chitinispirillaceae bacterium]
DGSYYTGHTDDILLRITQHKTGHYEGYTKNRRPVELVYKKEFSTRDDAFAAERKIKGWSRKKKEALICNDWEMISQLSRKTEKKDLL